MNLGFKTQKQLEEHVRNLLRKIGAGNKVPVEHEPFFHQLIARHPEHLAKIGVGVGVKAFEVIKNLLNPKALGLDILRIDGSRIDISWVKCVSTKAQSASQNLKKAMRYAIRGQISEFREKQLYANGYCGICGKHVARREASNIHVDHVSPFDWLAEEFIAKRADNPTTFRDVFGGNSAAFYAKDAQYEKEWEEFHKKSASLRLACKGCNLSRSRIDLAALLS